METIGYLRNCVFVVHVHVKVRIIIHVQYVYMHWRPEDRGCCHLDVVCFTLRQASQWPGAHGLS